MYRVFYTKDFRKSFKKLQKSGEFSIGIQKKMELAVNTLASGKSLPKIYHDHKLKGNFAGQRECHIKGDLVFVYQIKKEVLVLVVINIGTHAQMFG